MKADNTTNWTGLQNTGSGRAFQESQPIGFLLLASVALLMTLTSTGQGKSWLSVDYDAQPAGKNLQSAYLLRGRAAQPWAPGLRPPLQAHFDDVLRILERDTERSLLVALDRLEASREASWMPEEREVAQQRLASERQRNIAVLREYRARGLFPVNDVDPDRAIPIFVDRQNTACAVGYLMFRSGAGQAVDAIVQANNLVYVTDVQDGPLVDWVLTSGLTQEEAALIQPGYIPGLSWTRIDTPPGGDQTIESLRFSAFSSEFIPDPAFPDSASSSADYYFAVGPDSWGNEVPGGRHGILTNLPIHIAVGRRFWDNSLIESTASGEAGHSTTYEFQVSAVEYERINRLAIATREIYIVSGPANGRIRIEANLYDAEGRLVGEISLDSTEPGNTVPFWDDLLSFSAEEAAGFGPTSSLRVVTTVKVWGRASVPSLTYGLNVIEPKFEYEIIDNTVKLTGFPYRAAGTILVPAEIEGLPVTHLGADTFAYHPDLTSIHLPATLTAIDDGAFDGCRGLESITVDPQNTVYAEFDGALFDASMKVLHRYPVGKAGSFAMPETATEIGPSAFYRCTGLTGIDIGNRVTSIGDGAFSGCTGLAHVTIPNSVSTVGDNAFYMCGGLTSVTFQDGANATHIGHETFRLCEGLASVTLGNGVASIGRSAFLSCSSLSSITLPDSVSTVGAGAFSDCRSLTNVFIGVGVTNIGSSAFSDCLSLVSITVAEGNAAYSSLDGVLFNKTQTALLQYPVKKAGADYVIPSGITSIGYKVFAGPGNLTSLTIPASVASIEDRAFYYSTGLKRVYFQGDAPSLGYAAFSSVPATFYHLPGTSGWTSSFGGRRAVQWKPRILTDDGVFGVQRSQFSFTIMGAPDVPVAVEACSDLAHPTWTLVTHLTCDAEGTAQFTDPEAADQPGRYYRFRPE